MKNLILIVAIIFSVAAGASSPQTGDVAPDFSAKGADGKIYKLSDLKGKTVVLEWFNKDCPYVKKFYDAKAMQKLQKDATSQGVVWLTVASSAPGKEGFVDASAAKQIRSEKGMDNTAILIDS